MMRRSLLVACAMMLSQAALAQEGVTRLVVSFPPGGPVDTVARALAEQLSHELGGTVLVVNKPGANGAIAAQEVAQSKPDGTTLWLSSVGAVAINPSLYPHLAYNMARDFTPVGRVVNNVEVLVTNDANPAKDAAAFVAASKVAKEPTPMGSTGVGSVPHLAIEQLAEATGARLLHVPYKGAAPANTDLLGGQISGMFGDIAGLVGLIHGGKLRALGVAAPTRSPVLPGVKTLAEQGIQGVDTNNWYGLFAPAKTPAAKVASLNLAVTKALNTPALHDKLQALGSDPAPSTPAELAALLAADTAKWGRLIKAKHIRIQ
ncbi:MAG: tripartite tricarboxylate transporter substrate binding protein [Rhodospirillales bacterium]|nr:tripartite tricarboxylate transporter substrate binding protein [Rhodospirillales bacterium]MDE2200070.1 tripartite tricarboxylate transporter substrate binding protein [Rhodospirillales bacterium]MDE2574478.1 tripartite tricarboxylate transporter substrate binding protein [Rhodospirillales bacterium]